MCDSEIRRCLKQQNIQVLIGYDKINGLYDLRFLTYLLRCSFLICPCSEQLQLFQLFPEKISVPHYHITIAKEIPRINTVVRNWCRAVVGPQGAH